MKVYPKIAAITINYATADDTIECVASLREQSYPNLEIIVVDNASPDGSGKRLERELADRCTVIIEPENRGFSYGNNVGIDRALEMGAEYFLFINNDTILAPDMVMRLFEECNGRTVTLPKTFYYSEPDVLWDTGGAATRLGRLYNRGINEKDVGQYDAEKEVSFFTGHCLLMPTACVREAGKWDESFFMYVEDTEYSLRVREHGFRICYVPKARLWHKVSRSSGGNGNPIIMYYGIRNRLYTMRRRLFPFRCKVYSWLWVAWCEVKYKLLGKKNLRYTLRAVRDYRHGVRGKATFNDGK